MAARVIHFNNLLKDILSLLSARFPQDKDVEYTRNQVELATSVSTRRVIENFSNTVRPYLQKIHDRDETFFLNKATTDSYLQDLNIHDKWASLSKEDREHLWKNVQKMVILGDKILNE